MDMIEIIAAIAVTLNVAVYSMKTMIPLRVAAIGTNSFFIVYSVLAGVYPTLILNCILLPLNSFRLYQMVALIRRIKRANETDFDMNWLKPFMRKRAVTNGEILFRKGDAADAMYLVVSGKFGLLESGVTIPVGAVVGEMGLLAPGGQRTQSLVCQQDGELLAISYKDFKQLYYQNPEFGFHFLELTTNRLFENIRRLESELAARDKASGQDAKAPA